MHGGPTGGARDEQLEGEVGEDAETADEREQHERDAEQHRIDFQLPAEGVPVDLLTPGDLPLGIRERVLREAAPV